MNIKIFSKQEIRKKILIKFLGLSQKDQLEQFRILQLVKDQNLRMELQFNKNMNLISYKKFSTEIKKRDNKQNNYMVMKLLVVSLTLKKCNNVLELILKSLIVRKVCNLEY